MSSSNSIPILTLPKLNNAQYANAVNVSDAETYEFAKRYDRYIDIKSSGLREAIDIGYIYRYAIYSPKAYSIHIVFDKFHVPDGAKLFVYDERHKQILGAFTSNNNKESGVFAIAPLFSDKIIIEYFEPYYPDFQGEVKLGQIYHGFIDISENVESYGDGECEVDVNCSEGEIWQQEKDAVCRIVFGNYLCSGALINNTRFDGKPYFLTANHCISTEEVAKTCVFYFNYENDVCGKNSIGTIQTLSGAKLRASSANSDFTLLEMLERPNLNYHPYYAGWDRNVSHGNGGVGIHHPLGLPKKISTYTISPKTTSCRGNNFYLIDKWERTYHGWGVTEGGSSGSPLFNNKHRIIGQLYGGCAGHNGNCGEPNNDYSVYGKINVSWDAGNSSASRLKDWLDPDNTNYAYIDGLNGLCNVCVNYIGRGKWGKWEAVNIMGANSLCYEDEMYSDDIMEPGSQVSYVVSDKYGITLMPGFHAKAGADFRAMLKPGYSRCIMNNRRRYDIPIIFSNVNSPISDARVSYAVANASKYKISVRNSMGDEVYFKEDTIVNDYVDLWHPENLKRDKYLITFAFSNDVEVVSNTFLFDYKTNNTSEYRETTGGFDEYISDEKELDLIIYPNPTSDILYIEVIARYFRPYSMQIYDMSGVIVGSQDYVNVSKFQYDVDNLPQGKYIIIITMGNTRVSKPFIKI